MMAPGLYLPMAAMEVHGGALSRHCDRGRAPVCLGDATALRPERRLRERGGAGDSTKGQGLWAIRRQPQSYASSGRPFQPIGF